mmetsp:Transcript_11990/g.28136  ORF Transcript_11990/g.28136 Transcript_11990/m.28136 type:complete len:261 (+) Transcript_11990:195-977(+)
MKMYAAVLLLFALVPNHSGAFVSTRPTLLRQESLIIRQSASTETTFKPILEELRDVAMKLHTREQAPKEGKAEEPKKPAEPFAPTQSDYLQFLVDSKEVYMALEDIVNGNDKLAPFRNSGLERTGALEHDINWMATEFGLERPQCGRAGTTYAEDLRHMIKSDDDIPAFVCHFYNFYFAHMAGGRMIGKQMSKLLLDGEDLEFYKWDENVNELKSRNKEAIENFASSWTREERDRCVNETPNTFKGGGSLNGYLFGGSPH